MEARSGVGVYCYCVGVSWLVEDAMLKKIVYDIFRRGRLFQKSDQGIVKT